MAENVVENAQAEAEAVIAEAEAITGSAAEVLEASKSGGASATASKPSDAPIVPELSAEERARREMNRREFLTYTWVGALALVSGVTGFAMFEFLYPRFKAGEFGGKFTKPLINLAMSRALHEVIRTVNSGWLQPLKASLKPFIWFAHIWVVFTNGRTPITVLSAPVTVRSSAMTDFTLKVRRHVLWTILKLKSKATT